MDKGMKIWHGWYDRPFLNNSVAKLGLLPQASRAKRAPVKGGYEFTGGNFP